MAGGVVGGHQPDRLRRTTAGGHGRRRGPGDRRTDRSSGHRRTGRSRHTDFGVLPARPLSGTCGPAGRACRRDHHGRRYRCRARRILRIVGGRDRRHLGPRRCRRLSGVGAAHRRPGRHHLRLRGDRSGRLRGRSLRRRPGCRGHRPGLGDRPARRVGALADRDVDRPGPHRDPRIGCAGIPVDATVRRSLLAHPTPSADLGCPHHGGRGGGRGSRRGGGARAPDVGRDGSDGRHAGGELSPHGQSRGGPVARQHRRCGDRRGIARAAARLLGRGGGHRGPADVRGDLLHRQLRDLFTGGDPDGTAAHRVGRRPVTRDGGGPSARHRHRHRGGHRRCRTRHHLT